MASSTTLLISPDLLLPAARELMKKILRNAPLALGMVIESVNAATGFEDQRISD
jgi:enoyl-CoA hydratase/carnithine racemase